MSEIKDYFPNEIDGYFTWQYLYDDMVNRFPSGSTFVEVGAYKGRSLSHLIWRIIESKKDILVFAVDWFDGISSGLLDEFSRNMRLVQDKFTLIIGDSANSADTFKDNSIDFVFIDADHRYESIKRDILAWKPKIKTGGVIAGHDYSLSYPGVVKAVDDIFGDKVNKKYTLYDSWLVEIV